MNSIKKITAASLSAALAASLIGCTPSIGSGSRYGMTVDGYEVPAGVFIFYTMSAYEEAANIIKNNTGNAPAVDDVRNSNIDSVDSSDWIQNKATEYCTGYANTQLEFDALGLTLSQDDLDMAKQMAEYYYAMDPLYEKNGVSFDSFLSITESMYKEQAVFKYYYGIDSAEGCSEDELKDIFADNRAVYKYFYIKLTDDEDNKVSADEERKLRAKADEYVEQINSKSSELERMQEVDVVKEQYEEYKASLTTTAAGETTVTTTTTTTTTNTAETTTTTTTNPYANERLLYKNTTTTAAAGSTSTETTTETAEEDESTKNTNKFNDFMFKELEQGKAQVYDYSDDTIYIVIKGDIRERMTEDIYWTDYYISELQDELYKDAFTAKMEKKKADRKMEKNKSAYRRYAPFDLILEEEK